MTRDQKMFSEIGVLDPTLALAGVRRVSDAEADAQGVRWKQGKREGIWFPRVDPWSGDVVGGRLRRDHPEVEHGKPKNKYLSTYGDRPHLYLSATTAALLEDATVPVVLVESEKAALMLAGLADATLCPIGLGGCWGWKGTIGRIEDADGARVDEKGPSPDFDRIVWTDRDAVVWLDTNVATNPKVQAAERALVAELTKRGARVRLARVPADWRRQCPDINGPDDYYAAESSGGPSRVLAALYAAQPARSITPHQLPEAPSTSQDIVVRRASDITPCAVTWFWPGRIALGATTMIAGNPGLGKSQLMAFLTAQTTAGGTMPDGSQVPVGDVLYLTAEDDFASTVIPRLLAAGADVSRVHLVDCVRLQGQDGETRERGFDLVRDVPALDALLYKLPDVRLVTIDPVSAYLGKAKGNDTFDVRGVLGPVERVAQAHHVAVVLVSHLNKNSGTEAMTRVTGSMAFVAAARSAYLIARDPQADDRRVMLTVKQNLAPEPAGLSFTVEGALVDGGHGSIPTSRLVFTDDVVTVTADEALAAQSTAGEERTARDEAIDWLQEALADGARPRRELEQQAKADGVPWRTVHRGAKVLGVTMTRSGFGAGSIWTLPAPSVPRDEHSCHVSGLARMGESGTNGADQAAIPAPRPLKAVAAPRGESDDEEGATDVA